MTISVLVADDERVARQRVVRLLRERADVTVVAECAGGADAVVQVRRHRPDVALLDVQMPDASGFEVLRELEAEQLPVVVFITAYDQYALRAFEVHAVDYLLKPFETTRFHEALDRAVELVRHRRDRSDDERLRALVREVLTEELGARGAAADAHHTTAAAPTVHAPLERIAVRSDGRTRFVETTSVDWIESDRNYVWLHAGEARHLVRSSLASLEERLDPRCFVRIHRRYLVNVERVLEVQPWFSGDWMVILCTGAKLRMSRSFRDHFHERLTRGVAEG